MAEVDADKVEIKDISLEVNISEAAKSGLLTESDNVEEAILQERCENFEPACDSPEVVDEILTSASLTGSLHEMEDEVRRMSLKTDSSSFEEEFHDANFSPGNKSRSRSPTAPRSKECSPPAAAITPEDVTLSATWRYTKKHYFMLSEAGKPIYRHV